MDLEGDGEIGEPMGLRERASTVQAPRASQVSETWTRRRTEEPVYSKDLSPTERRLGNVEKYDHELGAFCMPPKIDEGSEPSARMAEPKAPERVQTSIGASLANFFLCLVTLFMGLLMPIMVDTSRTATKYLPGGVKGARCLPYSTASVVLWEALLNVLFGLAALWRYGNKGSLQKLWCWEHHQAFICLTLTYCLGDVVALCAIGRGGGLLFISMNSSRLIFAAAASHCVLRNARKDMRRSDCIWEWFILFVISMSLVVFAVGTTSGQEVELRRGTLTGSGLALLKAGLSALAAVLTERQLKHGQYNVWEANTLLKMQSFLVALLVFAAQSMSMEEACPEDKALITTPCIDKRGWDLLTYCVLFAEVGNGWLSVAILKRMSAIVKFVCKAAAAPTLYCLYTVTHFQEHHFQWGTFLPILVMTVFIFLYAKPQFCCPRSFDDGIKPTSSEDQKWVGNYPKGASETNIPAEDRL